MATIAELNIRLGLLTKEFDRELRGIKFKMERAGRELSSLGSDLTAAVSLPLVGLGFAAIKSAGDIEALRLALTTTMTDAGRSTADVTAELEALRVAALAPGLDFEQAIKASVRLQNVGFSAEEARRAIIGMAKAVALSGGGADDLNEVTNQFSQMIGKGKVFQDDIKILTGRMPKLASIMKEAFGTTTAEGINAAGISAKEFVDTIVDKMNELPQVGSGIKNSLVNLFVGLQLEAARFGEEINKAFNIGSAGDSILGVVKFIVDAFSGLSDGSKKAIVGMAALAAAGGPVVFVFGRMLDFLGPVKTAFLAAAQAVAVLNTKMAATSAVQATLQSGARAYAATIGTTTAATQGLTTALAASTAAAENSRRFGRLMSETLKKTGEVSVAAAGNFTGLTAVIQRAAVAVRALTLAQLGLLTGGIIVAVLAIGIAVHELTRELTAAEKAQRAVNKVSLEASDDISTERTKVVELLGVLKDQNSTRDEQKRALEALKAISPEYFKDLDTEKIKIVGVEAAVNLYIDSLLRAAKAKRAFARLEELDKLRENIVAAAEPTTWQRIVNGFKAVGGVATFAQIESAQLGENIAKLTEEIEAEEKAMREVIKANGDFVATASGAGDASKKIGDASKESTEAQKEAARQTKLYADALSSIAAVAKKGDVLGSEVMSEQASEIETQIERLLENGFKPYSKQIEHLRGMLKSLREEAGKGFATPNTTQQALGFSPDIPNIPSLQIPDQVVSIDTGEATDKVKAFADWQAAATKQISDLRQKAHEEELARIDAENAARQMVIDAAIETAKTIADSIISIQQSKSKKEITILEQEYATRIEAAQGNNQQVAALQEELAARKEAIEKKTAKKAQGVAIGQAIVNTAQGVTKALASAPPPFNFALAGLVAAAGIAEITKIKAQAFAKGGVVDRPTLALVGEYAGASNNPEIITPENKLTNVFNDVLNSFEFPFPEPTEQKTIKQEPLPAPVVNIKLGNVAPAVSDTPPKETVFSAISKSVFKAVNNSTDNTSTTISSLERAFKSVSNNVSETFESSDVRRIEREKTTVDSERVEANTISSFDLALKSVINDFSRVFESSDVRRTEIIADKTKETTGGDFRETNTIDTVKEVLPEFKIPEINIFQDGQTATADQPAPGISQMLRNISQSVVLPEMPRIQAPTAEIANRDLFTRIAPTSNDSSPADTLTALVRGDDLLFVLDKAAVRRGRTR